jgi:hypothetical protein
LRSANLRLTDLRLADLSSANLSDTCIDPLAEPNSECNRFARSGRYRIGYRTRIAGHVGQYINRRTYTADFFSVSDTECHPGLYIWPTLEHCREYSGRNIEFIRVYVLAEDIHKAGAKWRCRMFRVIGGAS